MQKGDVIYRQVAIKTALEFIVEYLGGAFDEDFQKKLMEQMNALPSAQPTLYGYKIEHLAYIARVMEKEGITAEQAAESFDDICTAIRLLIEETTQKVNEFVREMRGGHE